MAFRDQDRACPKAEPRERSKKYRDFVDGRPCAVCGREQSTHHHHGPKGLSETLGDLDCVPLCFTTGDLVGCHDKYHAGNLTYLERERIEPGKLATLRAYIWTFHDCPSVLALDPDQLKAWLIKHHPEGFDEASNKRPRKHKAKVRKGRKLKGRKKIQSRGFPKPKRKPCKMGERKPENER